MIKISDNFQLDEKDISFDFIRSAGPGGQNVNKVATAVRLRFNIHGVTVIAEDVKNRLKKLAGKRLTDEGVLLIEASRFRKQEQNRQDAIERLSELIRTALIKPKKRVPTRPTKASVERIQTSKKHKSQLKKTRRQVVMCIV